MVGDGGFATCGCTSPGGTGSPQNPYILENWEITTPSGLDDGAIHISNTAAFFIIRNVYIHPATFSRESSGILFHNVQNGRVENTTIQNAQYGIWLALSNTNTVINNNAYNNTYGIYVTGGSGNTITYNQVSNNAVYGMWVTGASNNLVTGNTASNNQAGFVIGTSTNNLFANNFASNNTDNTRRGYGFRILFSTGNIFQNNTVINTPFALIFEYSSGNQAIGNRLFNNDYGIGLERENTGNTVTGNNATNNYYGVYVYNSPGNLLYNNYLRNTLNAYDDVSYPVKLRVTDNVGAFTIYSLPVTVSQAPPRIATEFTFNPSSPGPGTDVSFTATASGGNPPYTFTWTFGDGINATGQTTTHAYSSSSFTPYAVTLTSKDSYGLFSTVRHYVSVQAGLIADFTSTATGLTPYSFTFKGSASGGTGPYMFAWDFGDGNTTTTANTVDHTYSPGSFTAWNTARTIGTNILGGPFLGGNYYANYPGVDSEGDGIGDTAYPISGGPNQDQLPLVPTTSSTVHDVAITGIQVQPLSLKVGGTFQITVSYSNRGTSPETFDITVLYGPTIVGTQTLTNLGASTSGSATFSWPTQAVAPGLYYLRARASTAPGEANTNNNESPPVQVEVIENQLPIASFNYSPTTIVVGQTVSFDASPSTDDGTIAQYTWDFGDGATATGKTTSHQYVSAGSYLVILTVVDDSGAFGTDTKTISTSPNSPGQPANLRVAASPGQASLEWMAPSSNGGSAIQGYSIYRGTTATTLTLLEKIGNRTSYVDSSVASGITYYYKVAAYNSQAEGMASTPEDILVPAQPSSGTSNLPDTTLIIAAAIIGVIIVLAVAILVMRRKPAR